MLPLQTAQNLSQQIDEVLTSLSKIEQTEFVTFESGNAEKTYSGFGEPYEKVQELFKSVEKDYKKETDNVHKIVLWSHFIQTHYTTSLFLIEFGPREQRTKNEIIIYRKYLKKLKQEIEENSEIAARVKSPLTEASRSNSTDTPSP